MNNKIVTHAELRLYQRAFETAMELFDVSKTFPKEETYALTDQIRRSSRAVCANLAEGWRKRRYEKAFISKLSDAEGEAAETQTWIAFAVRCGYLDPTRGDALHHTYDEVIRMIVSMIQHPQRWLILNDTAIREPDVPYDVEATFEEDEHDSDI